MSTNWIYLIQCKPNFFSENGATAIQIEQAEKELELKFSSDFKKYLQVFGAVSFESHELTGFSADSNLDIVIVTQKNRSKNIVPKSFYVIEEAHIDGIVIWQDFDGSIYQTMPGIKPKKLCNSLSEYVLG